MHKILSVLFIFISCILFLATLSYYPVPFHPTAWEHPGRALLCFLPAALLLFTKKGRALFGWCTKRIYECRRLTFVIGVGLLMTFWCAYLAKDLFSCVPHLDDSVAALFQAKIFLEGRMDLTPPPEPKFFYVFGILSPHMGAPGWASMYPPAWSVLLAIGQSVKLAWLVNPILAGMLAIAVYNLGRELYDERTGRSAALLLLFSPFVAVLSATHLSHTSTALFCVLAWLNVLRLMKYGKARHGLYGGLALGWAFLTRPITTVCVGVVIGLGVLVQWRRALVVWKGCALAIVPVVVALGIQLAYQHQTTGDYRVSGHKMMMGGRGRIGFGVLDQSRTHTIEIGIDYTARRLRELNTRLGGWQLPSLLFVFLPFLLGRAKWREVWLLLPLIALTLLYAAYWYYEEYYPARYLFASAPFLILLSAHGLHAASERLKAKPKLSQLPAFIVMSGVLFSVACSSHDYHRFFLRDHGDVEVVFPEVMKEYGVTNALVFYHSYSQAFHWEGEYKDALQRTHTWKGDQQNRYYTSGFLYNTLSLDGDLVVAMHYYDRRSGDVFNDRLIARYPGRNYYRYSYDRGAGRARLYRMLVEDGKAVGLEEVDPKPNCPWLMPR